MKELSVKIEGIGKKYGEVSALENISININKSELFGFIGPDGSGKTSLFRILTTLLIPEEGKASVEGLDVVKDYRGIRNIVGYMPGRFSLYQDLSVEENLSFFASIFDTSISENYDLIKDIYQQIEPFKNRPAGKLSGGMKQKLALSCALIHKPKVLILDEPTTGVDAVSRKEFWEMLKKLQKKGITIIVSTPYMDEASLCDRIALIQNGKILKTDTPVNICKSYGRKLFGVKGDNSYNLLSVLKKSPNAFSVYSFGQEIHFASNNEEMDESQLTEYLVGEGIEGTSVRVLEAGIEDSFMELMN